MQKHKQLGARLLSLVLSVAMVTTMLSMTVFAAEDDNIPGGASSIGTIQSFDKLGDRFIPAVGKDAPDHVYGLSVEPNTPVEDLNLPDELGATVERATPDATVSSEAVAVTWHSDKEYQPDVNDTFIYTAELTEDYILADGVELPQIYVAVGKQARASGDAITVDGDNLNTAGLQKAFVDIADGGTITLGGDVDLGDGYIAHTGVKNITLDLNGHKVSSSSDEQAFGLNSGAGLTIRGEATNSKIEYTGTSAAIKNVTGVANITIESGTIESTQSPDTATISIDEGTLTVNGGTITSAKGGVLHINKGDITVSGSATITGASENENIPIIYCKNGNLSISGTPVITYAGDNANINCIRTTGGTVAISGGNISAANGVAIRAETVTSFSISEDTTVTSQNNVTTSGTIVTAATVSLSDTARVLNTSTGNAIYLNGSASYSMTATNVVGKIAPTYAVSGTIKGQDTNMGIAATLQLKHSNGLAIGSEVIAGTDGNYTIQVPNGTGYTIDVSMNRYIAGTISTFNVASVALTGKNLTLTKAAVLPIIIGGTGATAGYETADGATLQKAADAVEDRGTIKLGANLNIEGGSCNINDKRCTLDLNGNTISGGNSDNSISAIDLQGTASLTISDSSTAKSGKIEIENDAPTIFHQSTGELIISGGTISGVLGNPTIRCNTGTITIAGGAVSSSDVNFATIVSNGKITVTRGEVTSACTNPSAGTIAFDAVPTPAAIVLVIQGGTVSNTGTGGTAANSVYFPSTVTERNRSSYYSHTGGTVGTVVPTVNTIIVGGTDATDGYGVANAGTVTKALSDVADGGTVKLGAGITMRSSGITLPSAKSVKLDLSGQKIANEMMSGPATLIQVRGSCSLAIMDSVGGGKIEQNWNGAAIAHNSTGTLTIEGGTISSVKSTVSNIETGSVVMTGGTISAQSGYAIKNFKLGTINITGGKVVATEPDGIAINNESTGKIIIGGTAEVTSAKVGAAGAVGGTIEFKKAGVAPEKLLLEVSDTAQVTNTATPAGNAVVFLNSAVTVDNVQDYYTIAPTATVGTIVPTLPITININNGTTVGGTTLQAVVEANGGATNVTSLKITAGKVMTADWVYLKSLTAMTSFEIAGTVTNVADIPTASPSTFPTSIVSVTVPQAISIGSNAFSGCNKLTTATFPAATDISVVAFSGCSELTDVSFPAVETIENAAFSGCSKLETASFLVATEIGAAAFRDCSMLASASFPKVESLGNFSFKGCTALVTLKLGATAPTSVETDAFDGCPTTRALGYVGADGIDLADDALTAAQAAYTADANDGSTTDGKWYGWTIVSAPITVTINGTPHEGATLQEAITASGITDAGVTSLEITAGKVTTDDWNYLTNLTALTTFEIARTVTNVADIPTASPSTFPTSIVSVTVPQAISIGSNAFSGCNKLTTATFPAATDISVVAFRGCSELTDVSFPAVETIEGATFIGCSKLQTASFLVATKIGINAFKDCTALTSASFPKVESLEIFSFMGCTSLTTLKLGATPPATIGTDAFKGCPTARALGYVGADGIDLADAALTAAQAAYKADATDGSISDNLWYGWAIVPTTGGGGDSTPPAGGSAGGVTTPGKTVIDNPVGNQGSKNTLAEAVKNAIAAGTSNPTVYTNFANYTALTKDGLKAINDATAEAVVGKNVKLSTKVQLDSKVGNVVVSRITVNPVRLATVIPERLGLGVWFDQKQDRQVTSVTNMFEKAFDNKVVTVTFEQKSPLAVSIEFAAKPDLSALNTKNLYFYSYDPVKNIYNRITSPNYWVDKNGYSHITAPFGGSIIITDKPLTKK